MKTETQSSAELTQLCELIKDMKVAMLTTEDAHGALVSRPMSPQEMDSSGVIWFFTDLRSEKVKHLAHINLSFTDPDGSTYVSVSGRGEVHVDHDRIERYWTPFARPWFPDGSDSPNLALLKFVPNSAEVWDAPPRKRVRMFAVAASIVAGKPIGMGDHDTLSGLGTPSLHTTPA